MEDNRNFRSDEEETGSTRWNPWAAGLIAFVVLAIGIGAGYAYREQSAAKEMAMHDADMNATVTQLRSQLDSVTTKLSDMAAAQAAAQQQAGTAQPAGQNGAAPASKSKRRVASVSDKRYKALQARLDDQQKQLKDTQDSITQARTDLEGSLNSTKDELNGTIAKNHDELVALEKRGEHSYFEFDLTKSRQFQRTGPISLSLRRTDAKHMNYDLAMLVDDNPLSKKRVNLYEPIWFDRTDDPQPLQVVVNKVDKNHVHGYVSAPKYRNSELAANAAAHMATVAATGSNSTGAAATSATDQPATTPQTQAAPSQPTQ